MISRPQLLAVIPSNIRRFVVVVVVVAAAFELVCRLEKERISYGLV